jgi:hypothetical protein
LAVNVTVTRPGIKLTRGVRANRGQRSADTILPQQPDWRDNASVRLLPAEIDHDEIPETFVHKR